MISSGHGRVFPANSPARFLKIFPFAAAQFFALVLCLRLTLRADSTPTFTLRTPTPTRFQWQDTPTPLTSTAVPSQTPLPTTRTARELPSHRPVEFTSRLLLRCSSPTALQAHLSKLPFPPTRLWDSRTALVQLPSPETAVQWASELSTHRDVEAAYPIRHHSAHLHSTWAPLPNDPYFSRQWHLENNDPLSGPILEASPRTDLHIRAAWFLSRGAGITVACGDDGLESTHPDLAQNIAAHLNYDFIARRPDSNPRAFSQYHGTACAGVIAAVANNRLGGVGVAPDAHICGWTLFDERNRLANEEAVADAFQYRTNEVAIQNHSWGNADFLPLEPGPLEIDAVKNAVRSGRNGLGVVFVRAAGNARYQDLSRSYGVGDLNLDGYARDPAVISVGAVDYKGRVAEFSTPGACLLVAAPSGALNLGLPLIFTTDRTGFKGLNFADDPSDPTLKDYCTGNAGFSGTSASAPQIAGIAALMLAAQPQLGYRDVQQILALSAHHLDLADPDLQTNGALRRVSHNVGFGIPDALLAVRLAKLWSNRPPAVEWTFTNVVETSIPDDGLRVELSGANLPAELLSFPAAGSLGRYPDTPTTAVPLIDLGKASPPVAPIFPPKAVLIERGFEGYASQLQRVAAAGAPFAIVRNNQGGDSRFPSDFPENNRFMTGSDFVPNYAVFIPENLGNSLRAVLQTNATVQAKLHLHAAEFQFQVPLSMQCEHVGIDIDWEHPAQGDLRVSLTSPHGAQSILLRPSLTATAVPGAMTFWSTQHLFENSAGTWTVRIADLWPGQTGVVYSVRLRLQGVPLQDSDLDGLHDPWELAQFGSLSPTALEDPDRDGWANAIAQLLPPPASNPPPPDPPQLVRSHSGRGFLAWDSIPGQSFELHDTSSAVEPFRKYRSLAPALSRDSRFVIDFRNAPQRYLRLITNP